MNKTYKIIGFMPSYNLYSQGYPFLETIYSALHVVDKLYILDGSSDDTRTILNELSTPKISTEFKNWQFTKKNTKDGRVIANVSNTLLNKLKKQYKHSYIYNTQANEVIHEANYELIKNIPKIYPRYKGYWLYYYELFNNYLYGEQYRL
ncbi:hypothetical protein B2A_07613, partial [mine drainage metagenome]